jgi:pilus assembly protein CpaB
MDLARAVAAWRALNHQLIAHRRLVGAALTGFAVLCGLNAVRPSPVATRAVWVAAHDLAGGDALAPADLRAERLPRDDVPHHALAASTPLAGRLLAAPMRAGEPVTDLRLLSPSLLTAADAAGDVAVPVRVADGPATLALVEAGDRVDIIASADAADGDPGPAGSEGSTVIAGVRILAVPTRTESASSGSGDAGDDLAGVLIVAATPAQAADLGAAAGSSRLTVTLPASG